MEPPTPRIPPAWDLALLAAALAALGCIGLARVDEWTGGRAFPQQVVWAALGLAAAVAVGHVDYRRFVRHAYLLFAVTLVLLVAVYFSRPVNGAHRWLRLGPLGIQPSELAKIVCVVALARYLMYRHDYRRFAGMLAPVALAAVPAVLVLREPDLGTATVFAPLVAVALLVAGARRGDLLKFCLIGVLLAPVMWSQMSREQRSRVTALFQQSRAGQRPTEDAYQLHQAKQVRALGGVWGSLVQGTSVDDPAAYYLPEAKSDFVFCVLGERLGLWGSGLVIALYAAIVWRLIGIGSATTEPAGRLIAAGVAALFAFESIVNTGMTVGLLPVTGVSLPLVSYGGSGMVAHCLGLGLAMSVAAHPGYEVAPEPFRWIPTSG